MGTPNEPSRRIPNGGRIIDQSADGMSSDRTFGVNEAPERGRFVLFVFSVAPCIPHGV
jgi:hypothetical protein